MKRIIAVFITLLMAVCLLTVTVSAAPEAVLSEDLQSLTCDDRSYIRGDISGIIYYEFEKTDWTLQVPETLGSELRACRVSVACNKAIIKLNLHYRDGSILELGFVEDRYAQELDTLTHDGSAEVSVSYYWTDENVLTAPLSDLKGAPVTVDPVKIDYFDPYYIYIYSDALNSQVCRGVAFVNEDQAYYIDYQENGIVGNEIDDYYGWPAMMGYKITDPELRQALTEDWKSRNEFGIGEDDYLGQALSGIFLAFVFALIPIGIFIPSAIFALRGKGYYRITWGITAALSAATLVLFIILAVMVMLA